MDSTLCVLLSFRPAAKVKLSEIGISLFAFTTSKDSASLYNVDPQRLLAWRLPLTFSLGSLEASTPLEYVA